MDASKVDAAYANFTANSAKVRAHDPSSLGTTAHSCGFTAMQVRGGVAAGNSVSLSMLNTTGASFSNNTPVRSRARATRCCRVTLTAFTGQYFQRLGRLNPSTAPAREHQPAA